VCLFCNRVAKFVLHDLGTRCISMALTLTEGFLNLRTNSLGIDRGRDYPAPKSRADNEVCASIFVRGPLRVTASWREIELFTW
jgi:hypothetical protein